MEGWRRACRQSLSHSLMRGMLVHMSKNCCSEYWSRGSFTREEYCHTMSDEC
jgi:hypothetical protein